jgi:hypothetical protein
VKAELRSYIQRHPGLSNAEKLVGGLLVDWYNPARGYAWPSVRQVSEALDLGESTIHRATAKLDQLGLIRKKVGGGWDGKKARHRANEYYPAFSLVLNPTTRQIIKNAPYPSLESPETRRNPGKYALNAAGSRNERVLLAGTPQETAEVPPRNETPYTDTVDAAGASASPATPISVSMATSSAPSADTSAASSSGCSAKIAPTGSIPDEKLRLSFKISLQNSSGMFKTDRLQSVVRTAAFSSVSGHCEWLQ